ncbi:HET and ankyrin domain protein [Fusarium tjaetaba]|uniref:HET and ankyrin domain protein n=1 Tax=Fusarium tjaetaba TaxID=1567544 RepID=A0A8H5R183_9HYPO|nr:HET and ankyrin domain protein [Fusarium tjaetaba]KAF5624689.1 HET and ankyrin domain protein [Fusarium tjaetaba]
MGRMKGRAHESLLHSAVTGGNWAFAEALISMGVDVNTPREGLYRETPLHSVFREWCGDELVKAKRLIGWGADVNARDVRGNTPLALAMMTRIFGSAISDGDESGSQNEGENDNATTEKPDTDKSRLEAIEYLLQHGAHTNMKNRDGMTLLGIACVHAMVTPEVFEMLLQHSADVNAIQGNSRVKMSPLDILHLHDTPGSTEEKSDNGGLARVRGMGYRKAYFLGT